MKTEEIVRHRVSLQSICDEFFKRNQAVTIDEISDFCIKNNVSHRQNLVTQKNANFILLNMISAPMIDGSGMITGACITNQSWANFVKLKCARSMTFTVMQENLQFIKTLAMDYKTNPNTCLNDILTFAKNHYLSGNQNGK